jgi:hypothetical protein
LGDLMHLLLLLLLVCLPKGHSRHLSGQLLSQNQQQQQEQQQ